MENSRRSAQVAGLNQFARFQKEESRRRLIEAAEAVFSRAGYIAPTVDDIAREAGVGRQTFYRHFDGKLAIGLDYFERQNAISMPLWLGVADEDCTDPAAVCGWIDRLFDYFEASRNSLRTFFEMATVEPQFLERVKRLVPDIIEQLGEKIPAFAAARGEHPAAKRRWIHAWLFLYHLREQCNMNANGFMSADRPLVVAAFAEAFLRITTGRDVRIHPDQPAP